MTRTTFAALLATGLLLVPLMGQAQQSTLTQQRIGGFDYTNTSSGTQYTTQTLGNFRYTTGSDGSRATTQRIGSFEYTTMTLRGRAGWGPGSGRWEAGFGRGAAVDGHPLGGSWRT